MTDAERLYGIADSHDVAYRTGNHDLLDTAIIARDLRAIADRLEKREAFTKARELFLFAAEERVEELKASLLHKGEDDEGWMTPCEDKMLLLYRDMKEAERE